MNRNLKKFTPKNGFIVSFLVSPPFFKEKKYEKKISNRNDNENRNMVGFSVSPPIDRNRK